MPSRIATREVTIALVGNPNTGKSTLFNALTGVRQRVGNYPGVTIEKKIGRYSHAETDYELIDLPGTYSLAPRSPDEIIAVDVLLGRQVEVTPPDVILCIVDASNLQRNLYVVSQVLELGRPTVIALNMTDVAQAKGLTIDLERLRAQLGVPVVALQANRGHGIEELRQALATAVDTQSEARVSPFPNQFQQEVEQLEQALNNDPTETWPRYLVERLLLDTGGYLVRNDSLKRAISKVQTELPAARRRLADAGCPVPAIEAMARYGWVAHVLDGVVTHPKQKQISWSDRIDRIVTHKAWGTLIFVGIVLLVFQSIFSWAGPAMDAIDWLVGQVGDAVSGALSAGALRSLLVDGAVAGVGAVLIFLPQILILFLFIAVLEDCGYMARTAYLMDKLMSQIGLSGKSFIPLLSSFACAVPGIMAARVIENRRDRLVTILVAPLMSCSARLPVYILLIGAFIPNTLYLSGWLGLQAITMFAMYLVGIVTAVAVSWALNRTLLKGETPPFVMELPGYKLPSPKTVLLRAAERGWAFVRRAGTLIFAVTIVVWAAAYFPHSPQVESDIRAQYADQIAKLENQSGSAAQSELEQLSTEIDNRVAGAYVEQSILGRIGQAIEPIVRPLGWDWRIGCGVVASFPAREVVIGTLGVIYNLGVDQDEQSQPLQAQLQAATWPDTGRPVFNVPVALSIMVFFALCAQCAATLAVMRRETNSWRWPAFTFVYMTVLAYVGALLTYQIGMMFSV